MTRIPSDAHEWISFDDDKLEQTWVFDVTFLESPWTCIFGQGCQGVLTGPAEDLVQGCCSYGAHFIDDEDVARVEAAAATLDVANVGDSATTERGAKAVRSTGGGEKGRAMGGGSNSSSSASR